MHATTQLAECRLQEPVLVAEVVRDEPRRDAGTTGDLRERTADIAEFGQAVDRDGDQLVAAVLLEALAAGGTRGIGIRRPTFA